MAEPAKAICVMVHLEKEECMVVGAFTDDGTGLDPRSKCETLWKSVKDDWPGWHPLYAQNEAATELMRDRRLWSWGMTDDNKMTARIEQYNKEIEAKS